MYTGGLAIQAPPADASWSTTFLEKCMHGARCTSFLHVPSNGLLTAAVNYESMPSHCLSQEKHAKPPFKSGEDSRDINV